MADETKRCLFCKKGFFVPEKGITSKETLYFCNNCFRYRDGVSAVDYGSETSVFHSSHASLADYYLSDDFWYDG